MRKRRNTNLPAAAWPSALEPTVTSATLPMDVGDSREALIPPGENLAATDPDIAQKVVADRLQELQQQRRNRALLRSGAGGNAL